MKPGPPQAIPQGARGCHVLSNTRLKWSSVMAKSGRPSQSPLGSGPLCFFKSQRPLSTESARAVFKITVGMCLLVGALYGNLKMYPLPFLSRWTGPLCRSSGWDADHLC